jgi:hypothetical protein
MWQIFSKNLLQLTLRPHGEVLESGLASFGVQIAELQGQTELVLVAEGGIGRVLLGFSSASITLK